MPRYRVMCYTLPADPRQLANCGPHLEMTIHPATAQEGADHARRWVDETGAEFRRAEFWHDKRGAPVLLLRVWRDYEGAYHESREDGKL
jgi:hypothetical protein